MIIRLSQKLGTKIKAAAPRALPLHSNPFADWSAGVFTAARAHYVIITNTVSFYSTVMHGRSISNESVFLDRGLSCLHASMADDGLQSIYLRLIAPTRSSVAFSKAMNRSVTGSMNDLIYHAKAWLTEGDLSPHDASCKLNEIPMSSLAYTTPRETLKTLGQETKSLD